MEKKTTMADTVFLVNETYDKLSYFDLYGNSVMLFLFMTFFVFAVFSYCKIMQVKEAVADDWVNQRCKPQNMLFAGFITRPEGTSAFQYTNDNFQYCVQSVLANLSEYALEPFQFLVSAMTGVFQSMTDSVQQTRTATDKLRNGLKDFAQDVLARILNVMIPIQKMFIALMDTFQKTQATMTSGLYTMLGSYNTLQSLMGAILEMIIKILVALAIIIVGLWIMPFTWPAAASMTAVFLAISIPLSIIVIFMTEVLHIKTSGLPKLRCFDGGTSVPLTSVPLTSVPLTPDFPEFRAIRDLRAGERLRDGSYVTAVLQVTSAEQQMYNLNGVIVSGTHLVFWEEENRWIRVAEHSCARLILDKYDAPTLYCVNTSTKVFVLNDLVFSDWDEDLEKKKDEDEDEEDEDDGYEGTALVSLQGGQKKAMEQVKIGDVLESGATVYGLVQVLRNRFHVLTTDGKVKIEGRYVKDYNNRKDGKFIL